MKVLLQEAVFIGLASSFGQHEAECRASASVRAQLGRCGVCRVVVDLGGDVDTLLVDVGLDLRDLELALCLLI